jgi:hypothetical protein
VRTQPFTVTGASCGALPAKIQRTLNTLSSIERGLSRSSVKSQLRPDQAVACSLIVVYSFNSVRSALPPKVDIAQRQNRMPAFGCLHDVCFAVTMTQPESDKDCDTRALQAHKTFSTCSIYRTVADALQEFLALTFRMCARRADSSSRDRQSRGS